MTHLVGHGKNGLPVYVDLFKSEAAAHIAREPHLLTLAAEALRRAALDKPVVTLECDMGRTIGYDFVVKTTTADTVFYAQLAQDTVYTRFTKNGKPLPTEYVSMRLQRNQEEASYRLDDIWVGRLVPPRPGSAEETAKSKPYWEDHAYVFGSQSIQPRTLTKTCPY